MRLYLFSPSSRALGPVALVNHLDLDCERKEIDLGAGDQRTSDYAALNANQKVPTLEDDGFVLWEANAIMFYLASKRPESGLWPSDVRAQADVMRWLAWESAHWDAESIGMITFEKNSRLVLHPGTAPEAAFIARGEQNYARFVSVLETQLKGKRWLTGEILTIADFAIAALVPTAIRLALPIPSEVARWYDAIAALPAWRDAIAARDAAAAAWFVASQSGGAVSSQVP